MTLPTFVLVGAAKSGTSSLYAYLQGHPDVFMSERKELQYFCAPFTSEPWLESTLERGQDWYEAQFAAAGDATAIGEASTHYTLHPDSAGTAARMAATIPEAKLIYLMRHPLERALSHYVHWVRKGRETRPVEEALRTRSIYLDTSRYSMQLEQLLPHFPRERILLLTTDELQTDRAGTLGRAFAFLGVDPTWVPPEMDREYNRVADKRSPRKALELVRMVPGRRVAATVIPRRLRVAAKQRFLMAPAVDVRIAEISASTRRELEELLAPDVARLREHLGPDFHCWGLA